MSRTYLDWNASAPLRPEARAAMLEAFELFGNPSSVHAEGRASRAAVERAREQVAALVRCAPGEVVFTSGATEAAALRLSEIPDLIGARLEHPAVQAHLARLPGTETLAVDDHGRAIRGAEKGPVALQAANSETGVIQPVDAAHPVWFCDATQAAGKIDWAFDARVQDSAVISGHKFGGPKGVGALLLREGVHLAMPGGGQEMGRRAGTENILGIIGMGAAAEAAARDLAARVWEEVRARRDRFEEMILSACPGVSVIGAGASRLPNTTLLLAPGWRGETQVMQMDLAGISVSAGSACSSGKARPIGALQAMEMEPERAACALRVSIGPSTGTEALERAAARWISEFTRRAKSAA